MKHDEPKDEGTDISGRTDVDRREQDKLPPRGRARGGEGTHGNDRKRPSAKDRPRANVDVTRQS